VPLALAGVAASALAFALVARMEPPGLVLGWVGLVPWLAVLDRTRSPGLAVGAALAMCVAFVLAVFGWFARAIETYTGAPWALALAVLLVASPLLEPQFVAFALARHLVRRRAGSAVKVALAGACAYVATEWASPKLFADTLGHGLYPSAWMRQGADVAGVAGLTFVLLLGNECVYAVVRAAAARGPVAARVRRALAPASTAAVLVLALLVYGAVRTRQLASDGRAAGAVTAGVVQADLARYDRLAADVGTFEAVRRILDLHFALSTEVLARARLDLLVWPETVYPTTFGSPKSEAGAALDREIAAFVSGIGIPLVFGAYDVEGGDEFNAAVFLEPQAGGRPTFDTYRKASLFPLTERVPAALESGLVRGWLPWLGAWKPGAGAEVVPLALGDGRSVRIAPLICYDVLDPGLARAAVRRGAELIVTLSNDSWFAAGAGPRLHLVGAAFLSVETRRPQVRATNTGISAVISPTGALVATAGVHERRSLTATVAPERDATTLVVAWGDWLGATALAGTALLVAAAFADGIRLRGRRSKLRRDRHRR
jgi:apolipoprotein N-acyltransferase